MKSFNQILPLVNFILAVFIMYTQPFGVSLTLIGVAAIVYAITKSFFYVGLVFIAGLGIKYAQKSSAVVRPEPMGIEEAFQAKNPGSVQHRLEQVKQQAPLKPKVAPVTGVLESPDILDNVPLQPIQELTSDALPGASIPASAKARVLIYPPAESFVPAPNGSQEKNPRESPYLQNGPDHGAVETSLFNKGTDLPIEEVAGNVGGVQAGAAPAF